MIVTFASLRVKDGVGVVCAHLSLSPKEGIDLVVIKVTGHASRLQLT